MKRFLCLLSLAGLIVVTGCAYDGGYYGGYYGPTEFSVGVYSHPYYRRGYYYRRDYWDRGRYYRH